MSAGTEGWAEGGRLSAGAEGWAERGSAGAEGWAEGGSGGMNSGRWGAEGVSAGGHWGSTWGIGKDLGAAEPHRGDSCHFACAGFLRSRPGMGLPPPDRDSECSVCVSPPLVSSPGEPESMDLSSSRAAGFNINIKARGIQPDFWFDLNILKTIWQDS